ncbi:MAG: NAD-dependent DNA ligase LigA [Flavobacteriales bacterium]
MSDSIKEKISQLSEELREHNYKYYILDSPDISDFDFDQKLKQLQKLEEEYPEFAFENSPTKRVGGSITKSFDNQAHLFPMLSLGNTYNQEDLDDFDERIKKLTGRETVEYICELKYDGAAVSLYYENGKFISAKTRGDGIQGDVISENIKTIGSVPMELRGSDYPEKFEIRGEVIMTLDGFKTLNEERLKLGLDPFANPRNTASGSIKMQDSSDVAKRPLDCFLYSLKAEQDFKETHLDDLLAAKKAGFKVPNYYRKCNNLDEVWDYIQFWKEEKYKLNFEIDGIVIKLNNIQDQKELGNTAKSPRWAISYKYPAERQLSQLLSIDYQIGRTGAITPVANLKPVSIAGTTVKRASLHNAQIIKELDLHENDSVWVEKGGEIIPKITGVQLSKRTQDANPIEYISNCPFCKSELVQNEGEANHYCVNTSECSPQILTGLEHFVSRKAMKIEGLGSEKIKLLFENDFVKTPVDFYHLYKRKEELIGLSRYVDNDESGFKYKDELFIPIEKVIYAFSIGKLSSKEIKAIDFTLSIWENLTNIEFVNLIPKAKRNPFVSDLLKYKIDNISDLKGYISLNQFIDILSIKIGEKIKLSTILTYNFIDECFDDILNQFPNKYGELNKILPRVADRNKVSIQAKTVENILISVENSKQQKFHKILYSIGIRHVGENVAKVLVKHFGNIEKLKLATLEELQNVDEIGDVIAETLVEWFKQDSNLDLLKGLQEVGLTLEELQDEKPQMAENNILESKKIVVSGVFHTLSRNDLKKKIEFYGGKNVSSISKSTDYLIAGDKMGPSKLKKAQDLEISIINEQEFLTLIGENPNSQYIKE